MAEGREKATFKDPSEKKTDRDQDRPKFLTQKYNMGFIRQFAALEDFIAEGLQELYTDENGEGDPVNLDLDDILMVRDEERLAYLTNVLSGAPNSPDSFIQEILTRLRNLTT